ncbi:MAG: cysteine methyltransferase [Gemmatimonadetes bacterium]|nr:cysteine methyltransferase [Gemmatimonadota bacterium]
MTLHVTRFDTPLGGMLAAVDGAGAVRLLEFAGPRAEASLARECAADRCERVDGGGRCGPVIDQTAAYFAGERTEFDLPLAPRGTEFQRRVWSELRRIPFGATLSYRELAARLGSPEAVRAVGGANGRNPICIIVPCHRVIGADGSLTGYGGGIERKAKLLALESAQGVLV